MQYAPDLPAFVAMPRRLPPTPPGLDERAVRGLASSPSGEARREEASSRCITRLVRGIVDSLPIAFAFAFAATMYDAQDLAELTV